MPTIVCYYVDPPTGDRRSADLISAKLGIPISDVSEVTKEGLDNYLLTDSVIFLGGPVNNPYAEAYFLWLWEIGFDWVNYLFPETWGGGATVDYWVSSDRKRVIISKPSGYRTQIILIAGADEPETFKAAKKYVGADGLMPILLLGGAILALSVIGMGRRKKQNFLGF